MEDIDQRIARACERAGRSVTEVVLVAATKTVPLQLIERAYNAGIRHFGENRVQEAKGKIEAIDSMVRSGSTWHMLGHLQTNKVNSALRLFDVVQSIDSVKLAKVLNEHLDHELPILLEVNMGEESGKTGLSANQLPDVLDRIAEFSHLQVQGLMAMGPLVGDPEESRPFFRKARLLRDSLGLKQLSMGMTNDFEVAIEEGATMVRIGRAIFGKRSY
ncbi:MAG: YggS family pyridoxal phosphate-dependent enzyme [Chloroflexota bacterium]|nr:YggS family pyridoxal phosphate-dependent enzyme [Chloroflexota bacterium]